MLNKTSHFEKDKKDLFISSHTVQTKSKRKKNVVFCQQQDQCIVAPKTIINLKTSDLQILWFSTRWNRYCWSNKWLFHHQSKIFEMCSDCSLLHAGHGSCKCKNYLVYKNGIDTLWLGSSQTTYIATCHSSRCKWIRSNGSAEKKFAPWHCFYSART